MRNLILSLILVSSLCAAETLAQTESRVRTVAVQQENTPDPIATLRDQIKTAPDAPERHRLQFQLAELLMTSGQRAEALAELNAIANSTSFDPVGLYNVGNFFARLGDAEASIAAYRKAIDQRNGRYSRAFNNLGVVLLRAGKWDEAQDALLEALKLESFRYAEASYNLGRVYSARGQNDLAAREWRRALAVDPKHDAAAMSLVRVRSEEKIEVAPQSAKASPSTRAVARAGSKTLTLDPMSFDFLQRGRSAAERGKTEEAVDNFKRLLAREDGYFAPVNFELSLAFLRLKRYDEALTNLLEVSRRDGARYPITYYHLARLYELKGELKLAEESFAQAVTNFAPGNAQFLLDLSRVREKQGNFRGSLEATERYIQLMQDQGQKPNWSDSRIAELRTKVAQQN